jgi:hypothetical protein
LRVLLDRQRAHAHPLYRQGPIVVGSVQHPPGLPITVHVAPRHFPHGIVKVSSHFLAERGPPLQNPLPVASQSPLAQSLQTCVGRYNTGMSAQ